MDNLELTNFYTQAILPQFDIELPDIEWSEEKSLGFDEFAFLFTANQKKYALIWIDYQESGLNPKYVKGLLKLGEDRYTFIEPRDKKYSPSIRTPDWKYEEKYVGWFTLLELL